MTKQDFLACMRMLNAYYIDWQFNFCDKIQVDTWYQFLQSQMDYATLKRVIQVYVARNDHGPNSPSELLRINAELKIKSMIQNGESD